MPYSPKIAICYWGIPRSLSLVYPTQENNVYNVLRDAGIEYDVYAHFWIIPENKVWGQTLIQPIEYGNIGVLQPTKYSLELQQPFLDGLDFSQYYYAHEAEHEWLPFLIRNHICALESQKRCVNLCLAENKHYDYVLFLRPDAYIETPLPIAEMLANMSHNTIILPSNNHYEGLNDRFAMLPFQNMMWYSHRVNQIAEFRKTNGRIVSEKYVKYIVDKYYIPKQVEFYFRLMRSDGTVV
jgi:hypothetical protein